MAGEAETKVEPGFALLGPATRAEIDKELGKYPKEWRESAVMAALSFAQDQNGGWLTRELIDAVAEYLGMPEIAVYEVATFYGMYDLQPVGRHKVCVCNSVSCMLSGSEELLAYIEQKYHVGPGQTTEDGRFTLKEFECLGACRDAPVVLVDKVYHESVAVDDIDRLLSELD